MGHNMTIKFYEYYLVSSQQSKILKTSKVIIWCNME